MPVDFKTNTLQIEVTKKLEESTEDTNPLSECQAVGLKGICLQEQRNGSAVK